MGNNAEHGRVFVRLVDEPREGSNYVKGMAWIPGLLQKTHDEARTSGRSLVVEVDSCTALKGELGSGVVTDVVFITRQRTITRQDPEGQLVFCEKTGASKTAVPAVLTGELLSHVGIQRPGEEDITWYKTVPAADAMGSDQPVAQVEYESQQALAPKSL